MGSALPSWFTDDPTRMWRELRQHVQPFSAEGELIDQAEAQLA